MEVNFRKNRRMNINTTDIKDYKLRNFIEGVFILLKYFPEASTTGWNSYTFMLEGTEYDSESISKKDRERLAQLDWDDIDGTNIWGFYID
jgi:hypothetical protein